MNPITNSPVKERMRQNNESVARSKEVQINTQLNERLNSMKPKSKLGGTPFIVGGLILGIILAIGGLGLEWILYGLIIGAIAWPIANAVVKSSNSNLEAEKQRLRDQAAAEIRAAYEEADRKTNQEIASYDSDVKSYSKKALGKAESLEPMVQHVTNMFQRMISHADSGAHMKFIESDFTYAVERDGISYRYQSQYTNPQDDYNFNRERYRDLSSDAECEGLARALAKLTMKKMTSLYPRDSINMSLFHKDAVVTLHFKGANPNFVPARNII